MSWLFLLDKIHLFLELGHIFQVALHNIKYFDNKFVFLVLILVLI